MYTPNFKGYAERLMGIGNSRVLPFWNGMDFIAGLMSKSVAGPIGDIYIFSEAWSYLSQAGNYFDGGFWGDGDPLAAGFFGYGCGDQVHEDHRTLEHMWQAIDAGQISLSEGKRVFLEGCHIGEIGDFAYDLSILIDREVECACGSSEEKTEDDRMYFESAARVWEERESDDYDGWVRIYDSHQQGLGQRMYLWNGTE